MLDILRGAWALYAGIGMLMIGNGLQGTLLGLRGGIEGFSTETLGYVMSGYFIGFLGGSRLTPYLLKRVGHVRVFAALGSIVSACFILFVSFIDPIAWFLMRLIIGFCFSGLYVVAESWINDTSTNENRGTAMATYVAVQLVGIVIAQFCLNLDDPAGYNLFVLISVVVSLSIAPILLSVSPAPLYETARPMTLYQLFVSSPLAAVGSFLLGGVFSAMFAMSAIYGTAVGLNVFEVSIFVSAMYGGGLLFQFPIGWLSDRMDRRLLTVALGLVGGGGCLLGALFGPTPLATIGGVDVTVIIIAGVILGGVANPIYGLLAAHMADFLEKDQLSSAAGGLVFLNGLGAMAGPIVVGYLIAFSGPPAWWAFMGGLLATISAYGLYRATQRPTVDVAETVPYAALGPRVTPVGAEIIQEAAYEQYEAAMEERAEEESEEKSSEEEAAAPSQSQPTT